MQFDTPPPIVILAAMPEEMAQFTRLLARARAVRDAPESRGPRTYERAVLGDTPLVLLTAGMGMVSAAAATEAVIERYVPRAVLNFGCAGAHREDILPGDVVVGTGCIAFDHGFLRSDGVFEARPARLFVDGAHVTHEMLPVSEPVLAVAEMIAALGPPVVPWPRAVWPPAVAYRAPRVFFGPVASSDRFTQAPEALRALNIRHATLCEDMEAAAMAQICALHATPFFTVKDISNSEFSGATGDALWDTITEDEIGKRSAAFLFAIVRQIAGG